MLDLETITERLSRERMRAIDQLLGMMWSMATGFRYVVEPVGP